MVRSSSLVLFACAVTGVAQSTEKVIVRFKATTHAPLAALAPHQRNRQGVRDMLGTHAGFSQASVQQMLAERNIEFKSFWIENALVATDVPKAVMDELRLLDGVSSVDEERWIHLSPVVPESGEPNDEDPSIQSNIAQMNTAALWAAGYQGQGVVVASIDSGVRWTHESLIDNYRGRGANRTSTVDHDFAMWDPNSQAYTPETCDVFGHGSHTMGTIAGGGPKGIGMAPKAEWIHAKGFDWKGASAESGLIAAAQWVLCPTKYDHTGEDCSKGADIVSCSFGGTPSADDPMTWMNPSVDAWRAAGVLGVFAAGNVNAFQCGSVMESAGYDKAIAVGGVNKGALYPASGKGPGLDGTTIKPDFVAPYRSINSICSAADSGNSGYMRLTGTSMATPHVAGAFALLLSAARDKKLDVAPEDLLEALRSTAVQNMEKPKRAASDCGGIPYTDYPNNMYGWGEPDVCSAAASLGIACSSTSIV